MNQFDILFRAITDYRNNTKNDRECITQRSAIISANSQDDVIEVIRKSCKIEEDWIQAIENGLEFIEKCIKEERQFIRSNGEVIPIEKVKRVSKDSVEYLAKHSNMVTREPEEGDDLVPDTLYTVERLSDFAVYENRFLYMLLCYLRDFTGMRYERILELTNTYNGSMRMKKTVVESNRRLEYTVSLVEEKKNDEYLRTHNEAQEIIDRMLGIYKAIVHYLNTPLMIEVAKAPMLKPPVTRTNVLRMNKNFRQALSLYEYITAYDKDGYEIIVDKKSLSPFVGIVAEEIVESVEMSSFLTYEHGLGIREHFKRNYEREEARRKEEERQKFAEQLNLIRRHLKEWEKSPEEYIAMLEKRIADLEAKDDELSAVRAELDDLYNENDKLKFNLKNAKQRVSFLEDEVVRLNHKYEEDMRAEQERHAEELKETCERYEEAISTTIQKYESEIESIKLAHAEEIEAINLAHAEEIEQINQSYAEQIEQINNAYETKILEINTAHEQQIAELNASTEEMKNKYELELADKNYIIAREREKFAEAIKVEEQKRATDAATINGLEARNQRLIEERILAEGRLNAIRSEYGLFKEGEDFSTEEKTDELEHQYMVFKKFYKTEWKKTKKVIKKEVFATVKNEEEIRQSVKAQMKGKNIKDSYEEPETVDQTPEIDTAQLVEEEINNFKHVVEENSNPVTETTSQTATTVTEDTENQNN